MRSLQPLFQLVLKVLEFIRSTALFNRCRSGAEYIVSGIESQADRGASFLVTNTVARPLCRTVNTFAPVIYSKFGVEVEEDAVEQVSSYLMNAVRFTTSLIGPTNTYRAAVYVYGMVNADDLTNGRSTPVSISEGFTLDDDEIDGESSDTVIDSEVHPFIERDAVNTFDTDSVWDPKVQEDFLNLGLDIAREGYESISSFFQM